jgi:hypothetical protein
METVGYGRHKGTAQTNTVALLLCTEIPDLMCHRQFNYLELKYAARLLQDEIQ